MHPRELRKAAEEVANYTGTNISSGADVLANAVLEYLGTSDAPIIHHGYMVFNKSGNMVRDTLDESERGATKRAVERYQLKRWSEMTDMGYTVQPVEIRKLALEGYQNEQA